MQVVVSVAVLDVLLLCPALSRVWIATAVFLLMYLACQSATTAREIRLQKNRPAGVPSVRRGKYQVRKLRASVNLAKRENITTISHWNAYFVLLDTTVAAQAKRNVTNAISVTTVINPDSPNVSPALLDGLRMRSKQQHVPGVCQGPITTPKGSRPV